MAVEREFAYLFLLRVYRFVVCCSPLSVFGIHFAFIGVNSALLWFPWDARGSLWVTLGVQGKRLVISVKNERPSPSKRRVFVMPAPALCCSLSPRLSVAILNLRFTASCAVMKAKCG